MSIIKLDPVKYEVFYNRLEQALNEAKETVRELSASIIVRDSGEVAQGLFLLNGDSVLLATGLLIHVQTIQRAIQYLVENRYADDIGIFEGDQFINNDSFIGGQHRCDMELIAPIFYKGEHVAWTGNFSHVAEIGAIEPGGMCPSARESYHEGILLPCLKLVERGKIRRDLIQMMNFSVRTPRTIDIDTRAKISGNERARKKITEIIDEFGAAFFKAAIEQLVKDGEVQAEAKIKTFRPGIYRARVYVDTTGLQEKLDSIESEVEVTEDGRLKISTPVVPKQRMGINNSAMPSTEGGIFALLLGLIFYKSRWNGGTLKKVCLDIPYPSALNADRSAAVAYGGIGINAQFFVSLNDSLSRMLYVSGQAEDIMAPCGNCLHCVFYGAIDQFGRTGGACCLECLVGAGGARIDKDGLDSGAFQANPWSEAPDIEVEEMDGPVMYLSRRLIPDSCGFGKFRGGAAVEAVTVVHNASSMVVGSFGSGGKAVGLQGIFGGYPGTGTVYRVVRDTDFYDRAKGKKPLPHSIDELGKNLQGKLEILSPSTPARSFKNGDIFAMAQWGAAGLGDPIERDPRLVVKDVKEKIISLQTANKVFCVEIKSETLAIDEDKTKKMREDRKKERLKEGIPAKEYIKTIVKKRRERDLPPFVLDFLDEMASFCEDFKNQLEFEEKLAEGV